MNCKNCHNTLKESQKYCDECGAKVIRNRLTMKALAVQINEQFLSIDNKFLITLIDLFKKPEQVIGGYIDGVRKKYIGVITYYAIALTVLGFQMFILNNFFPEFLDSSSAAFAGTFEASDEGTKNASENFSNIMNNYQGVVFSIFMPLMAVGSWLIYIDKNKHNYTEHLVINIFLSAQTIFFSFIFYILFALINFKDYLTSTIIVSIPIILYGAYVFKKLYRTSYLNALLRYAAAYFIYIIVFSIIAFVIGLIVVFYFMATGKISL